MRPKTAFLTCQTACCSKVYVSPNRSYSNSDWFGQHHLLTQWRILPLFTTDVSAYYEPLNKFLSYPFPWESDFEAFEFAGECRLRDGSCSQHRSPPYLLKPSVSLI